MSRTKDHPWRYQLKSLGEIRQLVEAWSKQGIPGPSDYHIFIDKLEFVVNSLENFNDRQFSANNDNYWQEQARISREAYEGLAKDLGYLTRKWKLLERKDELGSSANLKRLEDENQRLRMRNEDLERQYAELNIQRTSALRELEELTRDKRPITVTGLHTPSDQLVPPFRQFRSQDFEEICSEILFWVADKFNREDSGRRREAITRVKAVINEHVIWGIWTSTRANSPLSLQWQKDVWIAVLRGLGIFENQSESEVLQTFERFVEDWRELARRLAIAQPQVELIMAERKSRFDPERQQIASGSDEDGVIESTLFPAFLSGGRVYEKAVVWVRGE